jgi:hypothetical protein
MTRECGSGWRDSLCRVLVGGFYVGIGSCVGTALAYCLTTGACRWPLLRVSTLESFLGGDNGLGGEVGRVLACDGSPGLVNDTNNACAHTRAGACEGILEVSKRSVTEQTGGVRVVGEGGWIRGGEFCRNWVYNVIPSGSATARRGVAGPKGDAACNVRVRRVSTVLLTWRTR